MHFSSMSKLFIEGTAVTIQFVADPQQELEMGSEIIQIYLKGKTKQ